MKRIRYRAEQIIRQHKTAEPLIAKCKTVADDCRTIEKTQQIYHLWKQHADGGGQTADKTEEAERAPQEASDKINEWCTHKPHE